MKNSKKKITLIVTVATLTVLTFVLIAVGILHNPYFILQKSFIVSECDEEDLQTLESIVGVKFPVGSYVDNIYNLYGSRDSVIEFYVKIPLDSLAMMEEQLEQFIEKDADQWAPIVYDSQSRIIQKVYQIAIPTWRIDDNILLWEQEDCYVLNFNCKPVREAIENLIRHIRAGTYDEGGYIN